MLIDVLIITFAVFALLRGRDIGFVRQAFSTVGFLGGLFIGALLEPYTIQWAHSPAVRGLITISTTLGFALLFLTLGEYIGIKLKHRVMVVRLINTYDNILGSVLAVVSLGFSIWLTASVISALPFPAATTAVRGSAIITLLNRALPNAPNIIVGLGHLVDPNGFPQVFIGSEPIPRGNVHLPSLGELETAVNKDKDSVVKLAGTGCGGIVEGTGFVVGPGLVGTNAHVVAGISSPFVQDSNGNHSALVVAFNPNLDFAVLRVSNLAGRPLPIAPTPAKSGTAAAVVGYPGGGAFTAGPAAVLDSFTASGRNIYGRGSTDRDIYEIRADVIPGNSGGPLIDKSGTVIGVIFAQSTAYDHIGYALTPPAVRAEIGAASSHSQPVSTGKCAE